MRNSPLASAIARRLLRLCALVLPAILVLGATAASAQQNNFVGQWRGYINGITLTVVFQADGQYIQTLQSGPYMTQQSGPYKLADPNTIIFSVTDWQPKTQQIYHQNGAGGGYYTTEPTAMPSGATNSYVFNGPNSVTMTDQVYHGSITLTRAP